MDEFLKTDKSNRFGLDDTISDKKYNAIIGAVLFYGFALNVVLINAFGNVVSTLNPILFLIGYLVCVFIGCSMVSSPDPIKSFAGYNLIAVPVGLAISPLVTSVAPDLVFKAMLITGLVTLVMMCVSTLYPAIFKRLGSGMLSVLLVMILVELVLALCGMSLAIIDYIVIGIFAIYIGFDWVKANEYSKTVDNAVDSAVDLYLDIINVFIRVLSILSRKE